MKVTALKALALLALVLALSAMAIAQAHAQAPAWAPADEAQRAQHMVEVAEIALFKVESFINSTKQNESLMSKLEELGLADDVEGNASLLGQAKALLMGAKDCLAEEYYDEAAVKAIEAMRICREVFRSVHKALELAGLEVRAERPEVQAQGILVAVNRSLERIGRIEGLVAQADELAQAGELLKEAKALLNTSEIERLLSAGNVSEAAHRLAEANRLIADAFRLLKSKAEEKIPERVERFRAKIMERIEEVAKKMSEKELREAMKKLGLTDLNKFKELVDELVKQAKERARVKIEEGLKRLEEVRNKLKEFTKIYIAKRAPPIAEGLALSASVEVSKEKLWVMVKVTVKNVGNATILFPNAAYGSVIEKEVDGRWIPYYTPISAQVIVRLGPGEEKSFSIKLLRPEPGHYRVVVRGFHEGTMTPTSAWAEFTIS